MDARIKSFPRPSQDAARPTREQAEDAVRTLLSYVGDDPARDGLRDTPKRVIGAYDELFAGYDDRPEDVLDRTFTEMGDYDDFVLVRDITFSSHCEHHMMPFFGKAHIAYMPVGRMVGLSKLARLIDVFARRLQTQENLTAQIAGAVNAALKPRGVAVLMEAEHSCMSMRGVQRAGALTLTTKFLGSFRDDPNEQARFMTLVRSAAR